MLELGIYLEIDMKEKLIMAKAKVKLIMTAVLEVEIDPATIFDLDEFPKDNQPMIEDAIKDVIEGYLDVPYDFVKYENTEIGIKHEVLEYKLPIQEHKGNNNVEQMDYSNDNYIIKNKSIKFIKGIFNDEIGVFKRIIKNVGGGIYLCEIYVVDELEQYKSDYFVFVDDNVQKLWEDKSHDFVIESD